MTKLNQAELLRIQKIADKIQFCGYGGSLKNSASCDGDVKLLRKIISVNKTTLPVS